MAVTTRMQFAIGEQSNNPDYRLELGYFNEGASWRGIIQTYEGGGGGALFLNPRGGSVMVNKTGNPAYTLDVVGNIGCTLTVYCPGVSCSGNVQAATFNSFAISTGTALGGNQIPRSSPEGFLYTYHINLGTTGPENNSCQYILGKWTNDNFIRSMSPSFALNQMFAQTSEIGSNMNIVYGGAGLKGISMGTQIAGGTYGAIYWDTSDASINLYHSSIAGFPIKIRADGVYFPSMRGDAGTGGSGRLFRDAQSFVRIS
jgi:hypothetical protein